MYKILKTRVFQKTKRSCARGAVKGAKGACNSRNFVVYYRCCLWVNPSQHCLLGAISSVGQSYRLITGWSKVRALDGPPNNFISHGALAQLGARNTGSVEVRGSNPLCSTIKKKDTSCGCLSF